MTSPDNFVVADTQTPSKKIIQLIFAPQNSPWEDRLLGLADNGETYCVNDKGRWEPFIPSIEFSLMQKSSPKD